MVPGSPLELTEGLSVVATGAPGAITSINIDSEEISLRVHLYWEIMDVTVTMPRGTDVVGFLGRPDGSTANDIVTADGTTYAVDQVRGHTTALYDFTDSWRVTDLDDSMFTRSYSGFAAPNTPLSSEALQPYRDQLLGPDGPFGALAEICGLPTGGELVYVVDRLAIELAIGLPLDAIGQYTCQYEVRGHVTVDETDQGIGGLALTVDGPGLEPCTTTSGASGDYSCVMAVSMAEIAALDPPDPLVVSIVGRWPGGTEVAASSTATFESRAGLGSVPLSETVDLTVPLSSLPTLDISGSMFDAAGPIAHPVFVSAWAYDSADRQVGGFGIEVTPDPTTGTYAISSSFPPGTARVELTAQVGLNSADWFTRTVSPIVPGSHPVTFDVDYRPPTVQVTGTVVDNVGLASFPFRLVAVDATGAQVFSVSPFIFIGADRTWSLNVTLPRTATSVTMVASPGLRPLDDLTVGPLAVVAGPNPITFDIDHRPPVAQVAGRIDDVHGTPITSGVLIDVTYSGITSTSAPVFAADGSFTVGDVRMARGTTSVAVRAGSGATARTG